MLDQIFRAIDAVVDIHDSPLPPEPLAVLSSIARAATIVDIQHGEAPAGPELCAQAKGAGGGTGWSAVAANEQRRQLAFGSFEVGVLWRIVIGIGGQAVLGGELYRLRIGDIGGIDMRVLGAAQYFKLRCFYVQAHDFARCGGGCGE